MIRQFQKYYCLFFPFCLWFCTMLVLASSAIAIEDLVQVFHQALESDPILSRESYLFNGSQAGVSLAKAALGPTLSLNSAAGVGSLIDVNINSFSLATGTSFEFYTVLLTQPLFDGQKLSALKAAKYQKEAQSSAVQYQRQQLIFRVIQAYFGVLQAQANERVSETELALYEEILKQTEAFLKIGKGDIVAVKEAKARYDLSQSSLITAKNALNISKAILERITHKPVGELAEVKEISPMSPTPNELGPWVQTAMANQPLIKQAKALVDVSYAQLEQNKRGHWPVLSLVGSSSQLAVNAIPVNLQVAAGFLTLSVPLYDGQIDQRIKQSQAQAKATSEFLRNTSDQTKLDTEEAFLNLQSSVLQLKSAKTALESAKTSYAATKKGYELGTRSVIDLLTVISDLSNATRNYYNALYNHLVSRAQLKAAAGILNQEDILAFNSILKR
ncbi:membrane protein [Methylacidiphilum kamchatkense Kam1]|uniref:Membrane protein n=2 Tax=Methylacidiphilum kamchatkense Kam1 TaxID=1202785 RepID=A0ABR4ZZX0_9BACT|nr:TolC family outer membrane protein [Methylacidiphilum kamchatkense]KIE59296.1 membrane protein [Methylacidiphilum kamchatkense Kam1]